MQKRSLVAILAVVGLAGVVLLVTLLSGAGKQMAGGSPARIDACSMLDTAYVQRILGVPVSTGKRLDDGYTDDGAYSSTCFWGTSEAPELGGTYAILNAMSWPKGSGGGAQFLQEFYQAADEQIIPAQPEPLTLGDQSLYWGDGVAVLSGDISFGISVRHSSTDKSIRRILEEALANKILQNL